MIQLPEALLLAGTALGIHVLILPDVIWYFRELPNTRWMRVWTARSFFTPEVPRTGWNAWANVVVGGLIVGVGILFPALLVAAGGIATAIGGLELVIAIAWFRYLLSGDPIPTLGDDHQRPSA